jgi:hypothetical protein
LTLIAGGLTPGGSGSPPIFEIFTHDVSVATRRDFPLNSVFSYQFASPRFRTIDILPQGGWVLHEVSFLFIPFCRLIQERTLCMSVRLALVRIGEGAPPLSYFQKDPAIAWIGRGCSEVLTFFCVHGILRGQAWRPPFCSAGGSARDPLWFWGNRLSQPPTLVMAYVGDRWIVLQMSLYESVPRLSCLLRHFPFVHDPQSVSSQSLLVTLAACAGDVRNVW